MPCKHCPQRPFKVKGYNHEMTFEWFWLVSGKNKGVPFQGRFKIKHKDVDCLFDQWNAIQAIKEFFPDLQIKEMVLSCCATTPAKEELVGELRRIEKEIENHIWDKIPIGSQGPADYWSVERKMSFLESYFSRNADLDYWKKKNLSREELLKVRLRFLGI